MRWRLVFSGVLACGLSIVFFEMLFHAVFSLPGLLVLVGLYLLPAACVFLGVYVGGAFGWRPPADVPRLRQAAVVGLAFSAAPLLVATVFWFAPLLKDWASFTTSEIPTVDVALWATVIGFVTLPLGGIAGALLARVTAEAMKPAPDLEAFLRAD